MKAMGRLAGLLVLVTCVTEGGLAEDQKLLGFSADLWAALSVPGESLPAGSTFNATASFGNFGPNDAVDSQVSVTLGGGLTAGNWSCTAQGIASCPAAGSGEIDELVTLTRGDSVTFSVGVTVPAMPEGGQGSVSAVIDIDPSGVEVDPSNNTADLMQTIALFGASFEDRPPDFLFNPADLDQDGWFPAVGDCCEDSGTCPSPALVNPGAIEILGNGVDDDCDVSTDDALPPLPCSSSDLLSNVTPLSLANAIELCQTATGNEPIENRRWGVIAAVFENADGTSPSVSALSDMQNRQAAVLEEYGNGGIGPYDGATFAGLSTGNMRWVTQPNFSQPNPGVDFNRNGNPPASYLAANGGDLPDSMGCSGTCLAGTGANDSVSLHLMLRVPTNALGMSFKSRFFSADYLSFQCAVFNDFALALLDSAASGLPADRNLLFDALGNPMTVNSSFIQVCLPQGCNICDQGSAELAGTGMDLGNTGAGTTWLETVAPVVPGEILDIHFMVFDVSDGINDIVLLIDQFEWLFATPSVGTGIAE